MIVLALIEGPDQFVIDVVHDLLAILELLGHIPDNGMDRLALGVPLLGLLCLFCTDPLLAEIDEAFKVIYVHDHHHLYSALPHGLVDCPGRGHLGVLLRRDQA